MTDDTRTHAEIVLGLCSQADAISAIVAPDDFELDHFAFESASSHRPGSLALPSPMAEAHEIRSLICIEDDNGQVRAGFVVAEDAIFFQRALTRWGAALDRLETLRGDLIGERDEHAEEIAEWKDATGLLAGGDPGGVSPDDLRKFVGELDAVARGFATWARHHDHCRMNRAAQRDRSCNCGLGDLLARVAALPKEI